MSDDVKTARTDAAATVIDTITLAFTSDPAARWVYPEPHEYLASFPKFIHGFGGRAFLHGCADYLEGHVGAAMWLPAGVHSDDATLDSLLERTVARHRLDVMLEVLRQMGGFHPSEPHWYLTFLGVDPAQQHKGYGSSLLKHGLARCDENREPAYLESTNPRNTPLYERHGFRILGTIQVGDSPPIFPMLRAL